MKTAQSMEAPLLSSADLLDRLGTRNAAAQNIDAFDSRRVRSEIRRLLDPRHR